MERWFRESWLDCDWDTAGWEANRIVWSSARPEFFDRAIELLVFAVELLRRIVIHHDVGIDAVAFDDPSFAVLRVRRELRPKELAAVGQRERVANADDAAPGPFANQFAEAQRS